MLRLPILAGVAVVTLLAFACGTATPSPPPGEPTPTTAPAQISPGVTSAPADDEQASLEILCDHKHAASLANVAMEVERFDDADQQALAAAMASATANLQELTLGPDGMSVRDSAIGLMSDLSDGVDDPTTRAATTAAAAQTLRELETQVCPPPEM
jgi:hypothetical protein